MKAWVAAATNPRNLRGSLGDALAGAGRLHRALGARRPRRAGHPAHGARPVVFAMANPVPEIQPELAERHARVMATGRSDYPNQINNVLCFPGFFRGLLDSRAAHGQRRDEARRRPRDRRLRSGRSELGPE